MSWRNKKKIDPNDLTVDDLRWWYSSKLQKFASGHGTGVMQFIFSDGKDTWDFTRLISLETISELPDHPDLATFYFNDAKAAYIKALKEKNETTK